jgi:hypothetical protein
MNENALRKFQIACAWCGPAFVLLYGLSWCILGHNYPPPDPQYSAVDLVNKFYLKYRSDIMLGQALSTCLGMLYLVWTCQLSAQMWEREKNHILSLLQLAGGLLTAWVLAFCPALWVWCAEMAGSVDPVMIKSVHFIAWYTYDMTYMITTIETIAICMFAFLDKQKPVLLPRWTGVLALFSGLSFLPLTFLPYFKTGIFALNGYWAFHVAFITYALFTAIIGYYMAKNLKRTKSAALAESAQPIAYANSER